MLVDKADRQGKELLVGALLHSRMREQFVLAHHTTEQFVLAHHTDWARHRRDLDLVVQLRVACLFQGKNPPVVLRERRDHQRRCVERRDHLAEQLAENHLPQAVRDRDTEVRRRPFFLDRKGLSEELRLVDRSCDVLARYRRQKRLSWALMFSSESE